jgi:DNA replication protein DnaC
MRLDPACATLFVVLRTLQMPGTAQAERNLYEEGSPALEAAMAIPSQLLKSEMGEREVRLTANHRKAAHFPAHKDLSAFNFAAREIREALDRQLHCFEFLDGAEHLVLIGGPGAGNFMLRWPWASRPSSITASDCVYSQRTICSMRCSRKRPSANLERSPRRLEKTDLVVLGELGCLPFSALVTPCSSIF